jgi:hypothetical protein
MGSPGSAVAQGCYRWLEQLGDSKQLHVGLNAILVSRQLIWPGSRPLAYTS